MDLIVHLVHHNLFSIEDINFILHNKLEADLRDCFTRF
jgi:hypothetical protein